MNDDIAQSKLEVSNAQMELKDLDVGYETLRQLLRQKSRQVKGKLKRERKPG